MKKIGIFFAPTLEQSSLSYVQNKDSETFLISLLKEGLQDKTKTMCVATTASHKDKLIQALKNQDIDMNNIELLVTRDIPFLSILKKVFNKKYSFFNPLETNFNIRRSIKSWKKVFYKSLLWWCSLSSLFWFLSVGLVFLLLGAVLFSVAATAGLFVLGVYVFNKIFLRMLRYAKQYKKRNLAFLAGQRNKLAHMKYYIFNIVIPALMNDVFIGEQRKLVNYINTRRDVVAWLVLGSHHSIAKFIRAKRITIVPDIKFMDFPTLTMDDASAVEHYHFLKGLTESEYLICNSAYVKQKHLVESFNIDPDKVLIVPHQSMDLAVQFNQASLDRDGLVGFEQESKQILQQYRKQFLVNDIYLKDYDFGSMHYILSSNVQSYNNMFSLIKAYEFLLRKRSLNIKLMIVGDLGHDERIQSYIVARRLQYDVIFLTNISSKVLAALNHLAICAVNPSLFEKGFPFSFTEAYSVGTPSVMSDIPVVATEIEEEKLRECMLFDPYNLNDMVDKIEWAIKNREKLYQLQASFYEKLQLRSENFVLKEYINKLNHVANIYE